jgi:phosphoglycerate kinase
LKSTIALLKERGAKIILASHLGRPEGRFHVEHSLQRLLPVLSEVFATKIDFAASLAEAKLKAKDIAAGEIMLLENLRFDPREEENDDGFAKELAELAEVYINDAFACSHRAHASIVAITKYLPHYRGLLFAEELTNLEAIFNGKQKKVIAIIGGKKVSTKLPILSNLVKKVDKLFVAGAMANTFLVAKAVNVGSSYYERELVNAAKEFYAQHKDKIILPIDYVTASSADDGFSQTKVKSMVGENELILDAGPKTILRLCEIISENDALIWNGPLGMYEDQRYAVSTQFLGRFIASLPTITSVIGGGDIIAALEAVDLLSNYTYVSTAGGAFLEWLEGKELPGIKALE